MKKLLVLLCLLVIPLFSFDSSVNVQSESYAESFVPYIEVGGIVVVWYCACSCSWEGELTKVYDCGTSWACIWFGGGCCQGGLNCPACGNHTCGGGMITWGIMSYNKCCQEF